MVQLDLRKRETWQFLRYVAESRRPFHFRAAPPCGTASRAPNIPMSSTDHGPPPLRSERWPLGFPNLSGYWAGKVLSANQIYLQLCAFCEFLNTLNLTWSIENKSNSYMWSIEDNNWLRLKACSCQGDHERLVWGYTRTADGIVFDTSKEAAYPKLLCERFATLLSMQASVLELPLNPTMAKLEENSRVATCKQPRGRKIPPLVSEFAETKIIRCRNSDLPALDDKNRLTADFYGVPAGSKLLRKAPVDKGEVNYEQNYVGLWYFQGSVGFSQTCKRCSAPL